MGGSKKRPRQAKHNVLTAAPLTVGSPELGTPTLTVGQIVEQLVNLAPDGASKSERIRHWTREGLLLPVDQLHGGTGRHRRYSPDASYEVAILNALATAGLQLVSRPYVHAVLREARAALQKWHQAISGGHKPPLLFLEIFHDMRRIDGEATVSIREGLVKYDTKAEIMIVINLSQLFSCVGRISS